MTNAELADVLDEIGDLLEVQGANPFRVRAYRNASRVLKSLPEQVATIVADGKRKLTDIEGIGEDLAEKIATLLATGALPFHQELLQQTPQSLLALLRVPGLGPKKAAVLHKELGIRSLDDLRKACQEHRVQALKGFAAKTEQTILAGLDLAAQADERIYWSAADTQCHALLDHLRVAPECEQLEPAGSYRRGRETVGDLDIVCVSRSADAMMDRLGAFPGVGEVLARGPTKMSVRLKNKLQVDLRVVPAESFGAAMQYFTGSQAHNIAVRGLAKDRGLKINEYGVFRGEESIAGRTEEEVYAALDLPWFPPELRENRQEFRWAAEGKLPKLVEVGDIRGDLHMHTHASDGADTLEQMAAAAQARGLEYIAITDHSPRVAMANGLNSTRLRAQWAEIDKLNARSRV